VTLNTYDLFCFVQLAIKRDMRFQGRKAGARGDLGKLRRIVGVAVYPVTATPAQTRP
jgi:hypothetical protein